jgi:hypothetical protein
MPRPQGIEALLFRVTRRLEVKFKGQPWRVLLAATAGELHRLGAIAYESKSLGRRKPGSGAANEAKTSRSLEERASEHILDVAC